MFCLLFFLSFHCSDIIFFSFLAEHFLISSSFHVVSSFLWFSPLSSYFSLSSFLFCLHHFPMFFLLLSFFTFPNLLYSFHISFLPFISFTLFLFHLDFWVLTLLSRFLQTLFSPPLMYLLMSLFHFLFYSSSLLLFSSPVFSLLFFTTLLCHFLHSYCPFPSLLSFYLSFLLSYVFSSDLLLPSHFYPIQLFLLFLTRSFMSYFSVILPCSLSFFPRSSAITLFIWSFYHLCFSFFLFFLILIH